MKSWQRVQRVGKTRRKWKYCVNAANDQPEEIQVAEQHAAPRLPSARTGEHAEMQTLTAERVQHPSDDRDHQEQHADSSCSIDQTWFSTLVTLNSERIYADNNRSKI